MKKQISVVLLLLVVSVLTAQTSVWQATKGDKVLYVGGTIHLLKACDYPLPEQFDSALQASDVLYVEADIDKLSDPAYAQTMMSAMMLPEGETLQSVLTEDVYKQLSDESAKLSLPIQNLNQFKPSLAVVTLSAMKMMSMGLSSEGVDKHLMGKAKEAEKAIEFLESVEFQINLLAGMGEGNEDNFVKYSLMDLKNMETELESLLLDWKNGSSSIMSEQIDEMQSDFPALYKSLLLDRNKLWIEKIVELENSGKKEFYAVGTLHLHGDDGLIKMLEDKGYTIEQVK